MASAQYRPQGILQSSVQYVSGIGPKRVKLLNRLKIHTLQDLLYYFPRRYEDRRAFKSINRLKVGEERVVKGEVLTLGLRRSWKGKTLFELAVGDGSGVIWGIWFNQPFMKNYFKVGQKIILYGKIDYYKKLQIVTPEYEIIDKMQVPSLHIGRIVPIYPTCAELTQRLFRQAIKAAIDRCTEFILEPLSYEIKNRLKFPGAGLAIKNMHFPANFKSHNWAYKRLVFEEFFIWQLIMFLRKKKFKRTKKSLHFKGEKGFKDRFVQQLPFSLTRSQNRAIQEIEEDMQKSSPMRRLLQGEVASGKTVVAAFALGFCAASGYQSALMAPTEILAEQHYLTLSNLLSLLGVNVALLTSSVEDKLKPRLQRDVKAGVFDVVIGTHSLIQKDLEFKNLNLVVVDEQHKFGVFQRAALTKKGRRVDFLVMTATPIPRSLALVLYGDMDISIMKELPSGTGAVKTFWIGEEKRAAMYNYLLQEVKKGRQVYIVYPTIKGSKKLGLKSATQMYEQLKENEFKKLNLGLIHGEMKHDLRQQIMQEFRTRKIDILIATTLIEVGVDVPNADIIVIEEAHRFGLSQLHQLRGRVRRSQRTACCILLSESDAPGASARLSSFLSTADGFKLAQRDLDIRGPGEFFGKKQHGISDLRIGNIISDSELLKLAQDEARALVNKDPHLELEMNQNLKRVLEERARKCNLSLSSIL